MALIDKEAEFSATQLVTATAISTNVIDLQAGGALYAPTLQNIGSGEEVYLNIIVSGAVTASGSATVTFSLESDSTADLNTSATVHWASAAIGKATLVAGYNVIKLALPDAKTYERYLGVRYTVATGPLTLVSSFSAWLSRGKQNKDVYASGSVIL